MTQGWGQGYCNKQKCKSRFLCSSNSNYWLIMHSFEDTDACKYYTVTLTFLLYL